MNIFLSYASAYRDLADDLCCRLQAEGHEVFFDREDLPAGASFDDRIRQAIEAADLFIFLVAPESVAAGHYTRTELKLAARKWPTPGWHVLPVIAAPTPLNDVPAYLRALTLMQAEGNLSAEVVMEVADRARHMAPSTPTPPPAPSTAASAADGAVRYRSLQLRFSAGGGNGAFALRVDDEGSAAPLGLDPAVLERQLWADARPIAGSARRAGPDATPARLPADAAARLIGQRLYEALFDTHRGAALNERLAAIDPQRGDGLRFVIDTTDAPELARLPWEFLYSPRQDDFLFSDRLKPVVRWLDVDAPPPTLAVTPPLRMLLAVAAPADRPELAVGEELARLDEALAGLAAQGTLSTVRVDHTSLEQLDAALLAHRPHVLHFIGHGDFVGEDGVVLLESDAHPGTAEPISGRQLAVLLRNYRDSLRLVFLNSCLGAAAATADPFGGVAQSLIRRGIPAVIAMQFPVPDAAAVALSRHFYRYLAAGQPVDAALASARAFLYARGHAVEWGAPALYMRAPDGRLFDLGAAPEAAPPDSDEAAPVAPAPAAPIPPIARADAPAPRSAPGWRAGALVAVIVALVAGAGWLFFAGQGEQRTPPDEPVVIPEPSVEPTPPVVEPEPVIVPNPTPPASDDPQSVFAEVLDALAQGQTDAAVSRLEQAGDGLAAALSPAQRSTLAAALARAHDAAAEADRPELAARALAQDQRFSDEASNGSVVDVDTILALLEAGQSTAALDRLEAQLDQAPAQISAAALGADFARLIEALVGAAFEADARADPDQQARIEAVLRRIDGGEALARIIAQSGQMPAAAAGDSGRQVFYVVRRGDTLWSISRYLLGDGAAWPRLLEHHRNLVAFGRGGDPIPDPDRLQPGWRIHPPRWLDETGVGRLTIHVRPGDTLSALALRFLGDARAWHQFVRDNPDVITDPDLIRPGQVLYLNWDR